MGIQEKQKQTDINIQQKSALIWDVATQIVGLFKPHEYGKVILPMTVIKRFNDALKATKDKVVEMNQKLVKDKVADTLRHTILCKTSGFEFYNTSKFNFDKLVSDPDNIEANFKDYLQGFSDNVKDIIENFDFTSQVEKLSKGGKLFIVIESFISEKADMSPEKITSQDMGYIFEDLIRKFSESYNEEAGAHFTSRDIIYLMTELLIAIDKEDIRVNGCSKTAYDMTMGTSQMLGSLTEKVQEINSEANITSFGQEFNPETYAIAKADMLIKGGNASGMKFGDTLSNDQFSNYQFDYIISNPPFNIDWKSEEVEVKKEHKLGYEGRFGPGLPSIDDGQMLFLLNGIKKLKPNGRMAIIQGGSSLDNGDPESGPSNIRKYLFEEDYVEAIIKLPNGLFYNTPISTTIWIISKKKTDERKNTIQLIDATRAFKKRRINIGEKKVDITEETIELVLNAYNEFDNKTYEKNSMYVESKTFHFTKFRYYQLYLESYLLDNLGKPILKAGKPIVDKKNKSFEIVYAVDEKSCLNYFNENIKNFDSNLYINWSKTKVGFGIPFTRLFYKAERMILISDYHDFIQNNLNLVFKGLKDLILKTPGVNSDKQIDSKVSWVGNVPENWKLSKIKHYFYKTREIVGDQSENYERLALTMKGVIKRDKNDAEGLQPKEFDSYQKISKGDLVFKMIDLKNISTSRVGLSNFGGIVSPAYIRMASKGGNAKFAYYYFMSMYYNTIFNRLGSDGVRSSLSPDDMLDFEYVFPNEEEQSRIVKFLDTAVEEINNLLKEQEKLIESLIEYKKGLIFEVITGKRKV